MASITQRFLVPVFAVSARNAWYNDPPVVYKIRRKPRGVLPQKLGKGVRHASWNPYPISDQNLWSFRPYFWPDQKLIPYFRPEALEPGVWPERVTSCYGTYTVGVNIKRECTNHTLFQTKMVEIDTLFQTKTAKKTYPLAPLTPI